jgi:hypothetical protein
VQIGTATLCILKEIYRLHKAVVIMVSVCPGKVVSAIEVVISEFGPKKATHLVSY